MANENYYRIYAKRHGEKRFYAMDVGRGVQVGNLIYATILNEEEKDKVMEEYKNCDIASFEARPIKDKNYSHVKPEEIVSNVWP